MYLLTLHEVHTITITPLPIPKVPTANIHTILTVHIFTILTVLAAITELQPTISTVHIITILTVHKLKS